METDATNGAVADAAAGTSDTGQVAEAQTSGNATEPTGDNPAWAELLEVLPSSLHPLVKPRLSKWDQGVQNRLTEVQSKYKPYESLIGTDPEQITASMNLAKMIAENPRTFYDRLGQMYGEQWGLNDGQGQDADDADDYSLDDLDDGEDGPEIDLANNPLFKQVQEQQGVIAQFLAAQVQQEQQAAEAKAVEEAGNQIQTELGSIAQTYGVESIPPQAERMMLSLALQNEGMTLEAAAKEVMPLFSQKRPSAVIVGPGGGTPANNIDTAKMPRKDTKDLVARMLAEANRPS